MNRDSESQTPPEPRGAARTSAKKGPATSAESNVASDASGPDADLREAAPAADAAGIGVGVETPSASDPQTGVPDANAAVGTSTTTPSGTEGEARRTYGSAPSTESPPTIDRDRRERMIREAAYERYTGRGRVEGDPVEDWLQAEAEIDRQLARDSPTSRAR